jgi:hypothetical protein
MKTILATTILFFAFILTGTSQTTEADKEAIKQVIQSAYVEGLQNEGDPAKIDAGFHPGFVMTGISEGDQIWQMPIYTWRERTMKAVREGKKPRAEDELVTVNFLDVDVTGTAAVVKLEFLVGEEKKYVDYISLYKFENGWKIVGKIFYKLPEEGS